MIARRLVVRGRVQGVGFRDAMCREAARAGATGWVRNLRDGSVEALVQGPAETVDALVAWAQRGPPAARVSEVVADDATAEPALRTFEFRATA